MYNIRLQAISVRDIGMWDRCICKIHGVINIFKGTKRRLLCQRRIRTFKIKQ